MTPEQLVKQWRERAEGHEERNKLALSDMFRAHWAGRRDEANQCADELEAALAGQQDQGKVPHK